MVCLRRLGIVLGSLIVASSQATIAFVTDINSSSVLKFDAETGEYLGIIGAGFLQSPLSVEQNPQDGLLYVSCNGYVARLDPYTGEYLGMVGSGFFEFPDDITFGSDGTMYVTDLRSSGNTIMRFDPTTGEYMGMLGTGFLGTSSWGASMVMGSGDVLYVIGAGGTAIQKFNPTTGEYLGVLGSGFFSNGRGLAVADVDGNEMVMNGIATSQGSVLKFRTDTSAYNGVIASGGFVPSVRAVAMMPNGWILARGQSGSTEYVARFVPDTGEYKGLFAANWNIFGYGLATEVTNSITGTLQLNDTVANFAYDRTINYSVLDSDDEVVATGTIDCEHPLTAFSIPLTGVFGQVHIVLTGSSFLREVYAHDLGTSLGTVTMRNGNVISDDEVGPTDIDAVISAFGEQSGINANCDVDSEVGPIDIDIVIGNFGEQIDPLP